MPRSGRSSSGSLRCRTEWRPSHGLSLVLLTLGLLAAFAVLVSGVPRYAAWPLSLLVLAHGAGLAWRHLHQCARRFEFAGQDGPVQVDGEPASEAWVSWRGPLAFVRWRDRRGRIRRLQWWPDTLPPARRRELRLAAPVRRAARRALSMAP